MKKRVLPIFIAAIFLSLFIGYFVVASKNPIHTTLKGLTIEQLEKQENYQNLDTQKKIHTELNTLKKETDYTLEEPLAAWNPYGTIGNSLYLYFKTDKELSLSYTIKVNNYNDFSRNAKNLADNTKKEQEYLLIGMIAGESNTIELTYKDKNGTIVSEESYTVLVPANESFSYTKLEKTDTDTDYQLSNGLYTLVNLKNHTLIFDNEGTIRSDLITESYRVDRVVEYENYILIPNSSNEILKINGLGQIEDIYTFENYVMHHDFILTDRDTLLILATSSKTDTVEDAIIELDLTTGKLVNKLTMIDLLSEYVNKVYTGENPNENTDKDDLDWLHLNSIQLVNEDQVVVSSRELSTIIKIDNIFGDASIDYLIGQKDIFTDTSYQEKLLTKVGDFPDSAGQHSVNVEKSEDLEDGQYYLYFFNNNFWMHNSNPAYNGSIPEGVFLTREPEDNTETSQYVKYLVDENKRTYTRVQTFDVPYSGIVSNVQQYKENIVVNSGSGSHSVQEYTNSGELIATFSYSKIVGDEENAYIYREQKLTYNNLWFDEQ